MTKVLLWSDLHFEFWEKRQSLTDILDKEKVEADVLILAGDIVPWTDPGRMVRIYNWFAERWPTVIAIRGNHELYGTSPETALQMYEFIRPALLPNVMIVPEQEVIETDGARFVCGTMWYQKTKYISGLKRQNGGVIPWNDFRYIKGAEHYVFDQNAAFNKFLVDELRKDDILVTHMLPSPQCVQPKYKGNPDNDFFVNDVTQLLLEREPRYALFGHTHDSVDVMVGKTRCLANPLAYPGERAKNGTPWNPAAGLIEI